MFVQVQTPPFGMLTLLLGFKSESTLPTLTIAEFCASGTSKRSVLVNTQSCEFLALFADGGDGDAAPSMWHSNAGAAHVMLCSLHVLPPAHISTVVFKFLQLFLDLSNLMRSRADGWCPSPRAELKTIVVNTIAALAADHR